MSSHQPSQRAAVLAFTVAFGPVLLVGLLLALRDSSAPLGTATVLLMLAMVVLGPVLGIGLLISFMRRRSPPR